MKKLRCTIGILTFVLLSACEPSESPAPTPTMEETSSSVALPKPASNASLSSKTSTPAVSAPVVPKSSAPTIPTVPARASVSIKNFAFVSRNLTVKKGTTVTWRNDDSAPHTVNGDNGGPASATLSTGESFSFTFDTVGTFPYHCALHSMMTGTVPVTD